MREAPGQLDLNWIIAILKYFFNVKCCLTNILIYCIITRGKNIEMRVALTRVMWIVHMKEKENVN